MTTVLKLGGSVITEKDEPETVDTDRLEQVAAALGEAVQDGASMVVVHGGGSFGHHHAAEHGVSATAGTRDATAVRAIHRAMTTLNDAVCDTLADHGVPAVPVRPLSLAQRDATGTLSLPSTPVETMLEEAFVPVLHGDVLTHEGNGATILSGDEIVVSLARSLGAKRVGLCSTVPGVVDDAGDVVPEITAFEDVADALGESDATDVTGGMAGKVEALLGLGTPASIFAPEQIEAFLAGEDPGTVIRGT